jgi:hypothetical protein
MNEKSHELRYKLSKSGIISAYEYTLRKLSLENSFQNPKMNNSNQEKDKYHSNNNSPTREVSKKATSNQSEI